MTHKRRLAYILMRFLGMEDRKDVVFLAFILVFLALIGSLGSSIYEILGLLASLLSGIVGNLPAKLICQILAPFLLIATAIWLSFKYLQHGVEVEAREHLMAVSRKKCLVTALSKPSASPEKILAAVEAVDARTPEETFKIMSYGHIFRSVLAHKDTLRNIILVTSPQTEPYIPCLELFLGKFLSGRATISLSPVGSSDEKAKVDEIIREISYLLSEEKLEQNYGIKRSDVVVDVTSGTKTFSIALTLAAFDDDIDIQYIEQDHNEIVQLTNLNYKLMVDKIADWWKTAAKIGHENEARPGASRE